MRKFLLILSLCVSVHAETLEELYTLSEGATYAFKEVLPANENVVDQMYFTAVVESGGGKYTKQINGPARSLFQLEKPTVDDIYLRYLSTRPKLKKALLSYAGLTEAQVGRNPWDFAQNNARFAAGLARLVYAMDKGRIPESKGERGAYWKRAYQKGGARGLSAERAQELFYTYTNK